MKKTKKLFSKNHFSGRQLLFFGLAFALIGGWVIYKSFSVNPKLAGDCNNDNVVNVTDLSTLLSNYNSSTNLTCDFNSDHIINILDLSVVLSHYGQSYAGSTYPPTTYSVHHYWVGIDGTNAFSFAADSLKMDDFI